MKIANSIRRVDDKLDEVLGNTRYTQGLSSRPFEANGGHHADTSVGTHRCSNVKELIAFCCFLRFLLDGGHTSAACQARLPQNLASLASVYAVLLSVTRESNDADVLAGYKMLIRKVHPDKGGRKEDCQRPQSAKDAWDVPIKPGSCAC